MSNNTITENPFVDLYSITAKRCTDYASIIGFSIGTLKRLKLMTNDAEIITEIEYAFNEIETRFKKA
jgi:hypothetical protein